MNRFIKKIIISLSNDDNSLVAVLHSIVYSLVSSKLRFWTLRNYHYIAILMHQPDFYFVNVRLFAEPCAHTMVTAFFVPFLNIFA